MLRKFFKKPYRWAAVYSALLACAAAWVLLDTFVIPKAYRPAGAPLAFGTAGTPGTAGAAPSAAAPAPAGEAAAKPQDASAGPELKTETETETELKAPTQTDPAINPDTPASSPSPSPLPAAPSPAPLPQEGDLFYQDANIHIQIEITEKYNTTVYIAQVQLSDPAYLKTALAHNQYGRNIRAVTSAIAAEHEALFAINGDYYGFRNKGYVLRNGTLYRDTGDSEALILDSQGNLFCRVEEEITPALAAEAAQIWSFGPALLAAGEPVAGSRFLNEELTGKAGSRHPRAALGQAGPLRYLFIVADGRTRQDPGLTLAQLAEIFAEYKCETAYNLDGGGSASMVFRGRVLNNPTSNGRRFGEREVSDIVYVGYQ